MIRVMEVEEDRVVARTVSTAKPDLSARRARLTGFICRSLALILSQGPPAGNPCPDRPHGVR
jgi:hypothetical protein